MASDEDNENISFVSIGSEFDIPDDDQPRKKPFVVEDQYVVDSKGRRRFHGAFTGGFSAGYFNTVGSKDGFTPLTFSSSRTNRKEQENIQKPEDFMDDEDFGEFGIAPKKVFTKEHFTPGEKEVQRKRTLLDQAVKEGAVRSAIPGGLMTRDFVLPTRLSMGVTLLKKMGWKEGQGIGEKEKKSSFSLPYEKEEAVKSSQRSPEESFVSTDIFLAPKDIMPIQFSPKDNYHGIGYSGIDPSTAVFSGANTLAEVFRPTGTEKRGIKGHAFGVGAFEEEDDDIYSRDNLADYDMTIGFDEDRDENKHGWSGPPRVSSAKGCLPGFIKAKRVESSPIIYSPPSLPPGFTGRHYHGHSGLQDQQGERKQLSAFDRGVMLGDHRSENVPSIVPPRSRKEERPSVRSKSAHRTTRWDTPSSAVTSTAKLAHEPDLPRNDNLHTSNTHLQPMLPTTSPAESPQEELKPQSTFKPFSKDQTKQQRYEAFLQARKSGKELVSIYDRTMTEWEKERELEEFRRAANLYRPLSGQIAARFTHSSNQDDDSISQCNEKSDRQKAAAMGMFGKLTRVVYEWHPDGLLCKRFNISQPYPTSGHLGISSQISGDHVEKDTSNVVSEQVGDRLTEELKSEPRRWTQQNIRELSSSSSRLKRFKQRKEEESVDVSQQHDVPEQEGTLSRTDDLLSSEKSKIVIGPLTYLNKLLDKNDSDDSDNAEDELYDNSKRPSIDLFKAIFADSDEEEDEIGEGDNDNESDEESRIQAHTGYIGSSRKLSPTVKYDTSFSISKGDGETSSFLPVSKAAANTKGTNEDYLEDKVTKKANEEKHEYSLSFVGVKDPETGRLYAPSESSNLLTEVKVSTSGNVSAGNNVYGPAIPPKKLDSQEILMSRKSEAPTSASKDKSTKPYQNEGLMNEKSKKKKYKKEKKKKSSRKKEKEKRKKDIGTVDADSSGSEFEQSDDDSIREKYSCKVSSSGKTRHRTEEKKKKKRKQKEKSDSRRKDSNLDSETSSIASTESPEYKSHSRHRISLHRMDIHKQHDKRRKSRKKHKERHSSCHKGSEKDTNESDNEDKEKDDTRCPLESSLVGEVDHDDIVDKATTSQTMSDQALADRLKKHRVRLKRMTAADFM